MLHIALCEDDEYVLQHLREKINTYFHSKNIQVKISSFTDGRILLADVKENTYKYDFYILDIEMPKMDGIELTKKLKNINPAALIIFSSSHNEFLVDGYELGVYRFIPKDEMNIRFERALWAAYERVMENDEEFFSYESKEGMEKVYLRDICYVYKQQKNSIIQTQFAGEIMIRMPLKEMYERVNKEDFFYISRSHFVNLKHVTAIKQNFGSFVAVVNGDELPISRSNVKSIKAALNQYWGRQII